MIYPSFEGEIANDVYSNQHQKMFNNLEEGEEFFNFLKGQLVTVYKN